MRARAAVRAPAGDQLRIGHPARPSHAAILGIVAAAVAAVRHDLPPQLPHAPHSTKGEPDRQIGLSGSPERVMPRGTARRDAGCSRVGGVLLPVIIIVVVAIPVLIIAFRATQRTKAAGEHPVPEDDATRQRDRGRVRRGRGVPGAVARGREEAPARLDPLERSSVGRGSRPHRQVALGGAVLQDAECGHRRGARRARAPERRAREAVQGGQGRATSSR